MARLAGKKCLVTGAGRGIGQAIALAFAREGAAVAVLDRRPELSSKTVAALRQIGGAVEAVSADVADEHAVTAAIAAAQEALGGIDVIVNNAGINTLSRVIDMPLAMWDEMIAVDLRSVFLCTRAVLPGMIRRLVLGQHDPPGSVAQRMQVRTQLRIHDEGRQFAPLLLSGYPGANSQTVFRTLNSDARFISGVGCNCSVDGQ